MPLAILFAIFAVLGLIIVILDSGARASSPAPSMYQSDAGGWGWIIFIVCGLISAAAYASLS